MRKIKKNKEKDKVEKISLTYDETDLMYQAFTYILMQDMIIDLFNFEGIKRDKWVKITIEKLSSKNKIIFENNPPLNDYNTSEVFKYFSKISDKFTVKEKIIDLLKEGACNREFMVFLSKVERIYRNEYKKYVENDFYEMQKFTRDYIKVKLAGDLFYQVLEVNERLGKLERTFKTKFDKWCSDIEKDICQISEPIKLTNQRIANLKNGFKQWKELRG